MKSGGIDTLIHYPIPPHLQEAYSKLGLSRGSFPIANKMAEQFLSLPIGPHLDLSATRHVVEAIKAFYS
jgi:dTDP-4-amino-4,6-dideoxygalactose transaminase